MASCYIVESYAYEIEHAGKWSKGVVGEGPGSEKLYLHVVAIDDRDLARLAPRVDDHGNKQHDRLALPMNEEWWIAVEGTKAWPKTVRPKLTSRCVLQNGAPRPAALSSDDLATLKKLGASV